MKKKNPHFLFSVLLVLYFRVQLVKSAKASVGANGTTVYDDDDDSRLPSAIHYMSPRIVGGKEASPYEFPSIAVSQRNVGTPETGDFWAPFCGATIIAPQWLVTAAHCYFGRINYPILQVTAGRHGLVIDEPYMQVRKIAKIIRHQRFHDYYIYEYDIALIKVSTPFDFNRIVQPVKLPDHKKYRAKGVLVSAGWGKVCDNDVEPGKDCSPSTELKKVNLPFVQDDICAERLKEYEGIIPKSVICAGGTGEDACQGDSGGPLYQIKDGVQMLVGITSWGIKCALPRLPGLWTEVAYYLNWINQTMADYSD